MCQPGPAAAPGRVPGGVLALLLGLPQREVERVLLAIGAFDPLPLVHVVDRAVAQRAVVGVRAHAEVDVAVDRVGRAVVEQGLDEVLDRLDRLRGQRLAIGPPEAQALGVGEVVRRHLPREVGAGHAERPRGVVDLVVDVGDVGDERRLVALVLEEALEERGDDVGPRVADVDAVVDRRPARVDAHAAGVARLERLLAPRARVVQADLAGHRPPIYARCGQDGWPAPGRPGPCIRSPAMPGELPHARRLADARRGLLARCPSAISAPRRASTPPTTSAWATWAARGRSAARPTGRACARAAPAASPTSSSGPTPQTWLALREGELSGVDAFWQRLLYARGDVDLADRLRGPVPPAQRAPAAACASTTSSSRAAGSRR